MRGPFLFFRLGGPLAATRVDGDRTGGGSIALGMAAPEACTPRDRPRVCTEQWTVCVLGGPAPCCTHGYHKGRA